MELTQRSFTDRLERIRRLAVENPEEFSRLRRSLHEKGVECSIIVPLLEVVMGFDAMTDISYEQASRSQHGQRFDFLIQDDFLVEAKELGANLDDHYDQLVRYITKNSDIHYGLLTNGIDYQIWLEKTFIEDVLGGQLPHTPKVAKVFDWSLEADSVAFALNVFSLFTRDAHKETFKTIAAVAGYYASGSRGRPPILHSVKRIDEELRDRIRKSVSIQKGVYYDAIVSGEMAAGDRLRFENGCVDITVELTRTGTVVLKKNGANVSDLVKAMEDGWSGIIPLISEKWSKSDSEFTDPHEIIKLALNRQRLFNREQYRFERV